jgi:Putative peptidoglycan binding domain
MRSAGVIVVSLVLTLPAAATDRAPVRLAAATSHADTSKMTPADARALQSDLIWSGDYNGMIDGKIDAGTVAAIKSYQRRNKLPETGVLDQTARARLAATARTQKNRVGWRIVDDTRTGTQLGLPGKLTTRYGTVRAGSRWSSPRGDVEIVTFRYAASKAMFEALFERAKREPKERRVDYSVLRGDFFVVSGHQGARKFYVRSQLVGGEARGYTVVHAPSMNREMDPVVVAMSSAFNGAAAMGHGAALPPPRRQVEYGSALVVSGDGQLIAERDLTSECAVITIPGLGHADRVAVDNASGLALLRVYGAHGLKPIALAADGKAAGRLTLVGIIDPQMQDGGSAVTTQKARLAGSALKPLPPLGFDGAAAIAGNDLRGLVRLDVPIIAGTAPELQPKAILVTTAAIRNFLDAQKVTPASGHVSADDAKASVVRVICVRQ